MVPFQSYVRPAGLKDTVEPYNEYESKGTGFSFANYNAHEMLNTIRYAKHIYFDRKRDWNKIIDRGMARVFPGQILRRNIRICIIVCRGYR